ncbi:Sugar efflux transporter B [Cedecea neteri]|uniref:Sugar efflux transporter B n=1 Tax=Cedecea neteri TaxID=158822 RepID=A0A2X3JCY4_9ENTR|nr:Sugar efflux transporter B [Cedecea neteri]
MLGVPAGTMLGDFYGWRSVFAALCILCLVVFTFIAWSVPAVRIAKSAKRGAISAVFKSGPLLAIFGITALVVTGNFLAYTYITPFLEQMAGQSGGQISMLLLVYGRSGRYHQLRRRAICRPCATYKSGDCCRVIHRQPCLS